MFVDPYYLQVGTLERQPGEGAADPAEAVNSHLVVMCFLLVTMLCLCSLARPSGR